MRFRSSLLVLAMLASMLSSAADAQPGPGGFMSSNVRWVANLPVDSPGVGARVVQVGAQRRLYVTGSKGLTIYDVTNPAIPLPLGHMSYPHWQNEDVEVSADGNTVIIAFDLAGSLSIVIDASLVHAPRIVARIPGSEHTITCALADCSYVYGSSGRIYDLRDRARPVLLDQRWPRLNVGRAHDLHRDDAGYLFSDTSPRLMLDPRPDPANPRLITSGAVPSIARLAYQHNSIRPRATQWQARGPNDTGAALRPGELLLASGETNATVECSGGSGPFATWSIRDWNSGAPMQHLHTFRPVNGEYIDGDPAVNALGCSAHWFTERNNIVAAGWYENGARFLRVDPATGAIDEVGFFQPVVGSASGAYWIDDEYVYVVDYIRGIDILRFDRSAPTPSRAEIVESWLAKLDAPEAGLRVADQFACRLGADIAA